MNGSDQKTVRKNVAVLFGGRSAEHEISVITALELITAIDSVKFHVVPVYISGQGRWYSGDALLQRDFYKRLPSSLSEVKEVTLLPVPQSNGLREVVASGKKISLGEEIPIDVYFPAFHGQFGEDGCIQGLFEMADSAYTGCPVLASALAMNKYACKVMLAAHGIPVLPAAVAQKQEAIRNLASVRARILATPGLEKFPLFVKPCNLGSSIGIGVAKDEPGLDAALAKVFKYDGEAIIEPCVTDMFEINISVMDGPNGPDASVVEIPVSSAGVLTFEDKYMRGGGKKTARPTARGMASLSRAIDPDHLDVQYKQDVTKYALKAFRILGCSGIYRFDFMVDKSTGKIYFNELNPLPGSLAHYLWAKTKPRLLYTETLTRAIECAEARQQSKASLQRDTGFRALFR